MDLIESTSQRIKQSGIIAIIRGDYSTEDTLRIGAIGVGLGSKLVLNKEQTSQDLKARAQALRAAWEQGKHG